MINTGLGMCIRDFNALHTIHNANFFCSKDNGFKERLHGLLSKLR